MQRPKPNRQNSPELSMVVPIYKDAALAHDYCVAYAAMAQGYYGENWIDSIELIFVCDGGDDLDYSIVSRQIEEFPFVRCIELSRNFGQHIAITAGYAIASGTYIGMMNVDQQDPPDQIPILLEHIKSNDFDIVHGLSDTRHDEAKDKFTSYAFNRLHNALTGYNFPLNMTTLRIMNRPFLDAYNSLAERSRFIPGLEGWLGFRHGYIPIRSQPRQQGKSSYTFFSRLQMAILGIVSFSDLPLRLAIVGGLALSLLGFMLGAFLLVQKVFFVDLKPGYTSTVSLIVFLGGIQLQFIGLASLYIGRILNEVQGRPVYIVRRDSTPIDDPES